MFHRCLRTTVLSLIVLAGGLAGKAFAQTPTVACTPGTVTSPDADILANYAPYYVSCVATGYKVDVDPFDRAFTVNYEAAIVGCPSAVVDPPAILVTAAEAANGYHNTFNVSGTNTHTWGITTVTLTPKIRARVSYFDDNGTNLTVYDPAKTYPNTPQEYRFGAAKTYTCTIYY